MNRSIKNCYLCGMLLEWKEQRLFRLEFVVSFFTIMIQSVICYFVFSAVFLHSAKVDAGNITLYYIVVNTIALSMQPAQFTAWKHMTDINTGTMILRILRPDSYPAGEYLGCLVAFFRRIVFHFLILLAVFWLLPGEAEGKDVLAGFFSTFLGFTVLYLIQALIGCLAVWLHDILRLRDVIMTLLLMLGGRVLPSELLYGGLKELVYVTPIPYVYDIPARFLTGSAQPWMLPVQLLWIAVLGCGYVLLFHRCVVHNIEYGG